MEIVITDEEGVTLLELSGRMDATTAAEFDNAVRALPRQGARLLIDMAGLEYISSAGLRSISAFSAHNPLPIPVRYIF